MGSVCPREGPTTRTSADTACSLARRKGEALAGRLRQHGVTALGGARRYLEAAGRAGLKRAVVSASASTLPMLELAGLATLVEDRVDADVIRAEGLRARPAPDLLLAACRRLGVQPEETVTLTHSAAGVAAGHAAGLTVIGVGEGAHGRAVARLRGGARRSVRERCCSTPGSPKSARRARCVVLPGAIGVLADGASGELPRR